MGFYSGWSSRRGLYSGYRVRLLSGGTRRASARSASGTDSPSGDDLPEWVELTYFITVAVVWLGGVLACFAWMWSETSDFPGLVGRLTLIALALIPAVIVCGIAAFIAGFVMPIVVGAVKAVIALARWISRRRASN